MFMDKLSNNHLNCIGIISVTIATIMLILVIVLPIMLKTKQRNDFTKKSSPSLDNIDLWAKFPGDINSTLIHNYGIFNYKLNPESDIKKPYQIEIKSNFSIKEEVSYKNFFNDEKENTIYFYTNRTYTLDQKKYEETKINSINMGLFETLETITHPTLYKIGINSINYLLTRVLIEPDLFIRELFTCYLLNEIKKDQTIITDTILNNIPNYKIEKLISQEGKYINYSLNSNNGLFEWIKILGLQNKISKANWLKELFELTEEEISSILEDENAYLVTEFKKYNNNLVSKFNCEEKCGIELLYEQLINGTVISTLFSGTGVNDYLSLNEYLNIKYYYFDKTPEMKFYYENEFKKNIDIKDDEDKYNVYSPSKEQLESLLKQDSQNCLLRLNNSIYFIYKNKTKEQKYFPDLTNNQIIFLSKYFYEFLPEIFLYPKIYIPNNQNLEDEFIKLDPVSKTVSIMFQNIVDKTYKLMTDIDINLYDHVLMSLIKNNLEEKTHYDKLEELCPIIMQKILDDGKKVNTICSDENIKLNSEESLYKWMQPFYCYYKGMNDTQCNTYIIDYLKDLVYISEEEINKIFSEDYLGGAFKFGLESIKNNYKCEDRCDEKGYLMKLQYWTGNVTLNAPEPLVKTDTIKDWFPEKFKYAPEISFYKQKYNYTETLTEEDIDFIINLVSESENKFDLDNSNSLNQSLYLEKEYTLYMNNKKTSSLLNHIDFLIDIFYFKNESNNIINENENSQSILTEYSSVNNLIQGNNEEDKKWLLYLKSGNYFDNFKPNITKTTGLDIGVNLETKKQDNLNFDYYGISTQNDNDKRKINKMNDLTTLNIKKKEYDYLQKNYIDIISPLFNYQTLLGDRKFSDGFQYANSLRYIYFYDIISSRPLRFKYIEDQIYEDKISCQRYDLDIDELSADVNEYYDKEISNNKAMLTQKVNKPFTIVADFNILKNYDYKLNDNEIKNYICLDPITDMVIDSKINLIYGIYSRKFGFINKNIENDAIYPIFTYQRNYDVEVNSYEAQFPGITEYRKNMTVFIIIGVIVILLFVAIAVFAFCYLRRRLNNKNGPELKESLAQLTDSELRETENKENKNINSITASNARQSS